MTRWPLVLDAAVRDITGPEDDFDDETNGDPDSLLGEEDESGFDEFASDHPDPFVEPDDGFDDAEEVWEDDDPLDDDFEDDEDESYA